MTELVLLSGGLDSAVCLALAVQRRGARNVEALTVYYEQPHHLQELKAADSLARWHGVRHHQASCVLPVPPTTTDPAMYVPGRNLVLLALAGQLRPTTVWFGANADDHRNYPDCRAPFLAAAEQCLGVHVHAPLLAHSKRQVVDLARELRVRIDETWSCYYPVRGKPCGQCDACKLRAASGA